MESKHSSVNQYFDQVYVINLDRRPDRKIAMLNKLSHLGIKADFVQAVDGYNVNIKKEHQHYLDQPIGQKGSHRLEIEYQRKLIQSPGAWAYLKTYFGILQDAKNRNFQRILCFDDDVIFHKDFDLQFQKANKSIPSDWKLLYLGASQYVWKIPQGLQYSDESKREIDTEEPFYFPNNTDGSFAMGIHSSVFDLLMEDILKMNCPFDSGPLRTVIEQYPKKCFVFNPNIIIADVTESDLREGQDQKEIAEILKWDLEEYDFNLKQALVSIILPVYNSEKTIEKAIRSLMLQSYSALEIIVVNDASTDKTTEIVRKLEHEDSRIRLVSLANNKGVGAARNEGLKESRGSFIAFQDADDISLKHRIAKHLIPLFEEDTLFTVSRIYRSRCTMDEMDIMDQESLMELVESRREKNRNGTFNYMDRAHIGLVTTVYKREVFEKFGIFEEHRFGEDLEFIERLLYYSQYKEFNNKYNGHTFLEDSNIALPNIIRRIDDILFICSIMNESNLSVQFENKKKEVLLSSEKFRKKFKTQSVDVYPKLPTIKSLKQDFSTISYKTIPLNNFVLLSEIEHQILKSKLEELNKIVNLHSKYIGFYNGIKKTISVSMNWIKSFLS